MKAKIAAYGFAIGIMLGSNVQAKADVLTTDEIKSPIVVSSLLAN